jgi:hypothetical protein
METMREKDLTKKAKNSNSVKKSKETRRKKKR